VTKLASNLHKWKCVKCSNETFNHVVCPMCGHRFGRSWWAHKHGWENHNAVCCSSSRGQPSLICVSMRENVEWCSLSRMRARQAPRRRGAQEFVQQELYKRMRSWKSRSCTTRTLLQSEYRTLNAVVAQWRECSLVTWLKALFLRRAMRIYLSSCDAQLVPVAFLDQMD
jgi:hypothetical protein